MGTRYTRRCLLFPRIRPAGAFEPRIKNQASTRAAKPPNSPAIFAVHCQSWQIMNRTWRLSSRKLARPKRLSQPPGCHLHSSKESTSEERKGVDAKENLMAAFNTPLYRVRHPPPHSRAQPPRVQKCNAIFPSAKQIWHCHEVGTVDTTPRVLDGKDICTSNLTAVTQRRYTSAPLGRYWT